VSGGSMDYLCYKIENQLSYIDDPEIKDLMTDLAELMHDLEWWQSGDYSRDSYEETLSKFKAKWFGDNRNERLKEYINTSLDGIKAEIDKLI
jgi:hypothetical protein